jgi:hypothetical protein
VPLVQLARRVLASGLLDHLAQLARRQLGIAARGQQVRHPQTGIAIGGIAALDALEVSHRAVRVSGLLAQAGFGRCRSSRAARSRRLALAVALERES